MKSWFAILTIGILFVCSECKTWDEIFPCIQKVFAKEICKPNDNECLNAYNGIHLCMLLNACPEQTGSQ